jgi:RHS repeat-associated protein
MRGLDLSGTMQGAGGVGGLLAVQVGPAGPAELAGTTHFAAYDGNGNIIALSDASNGSETARYEYGPFAEPLRMTGPMAKLNPIRFSTQYADDVTGDLKYLFRDYDADSARWPSRDPITERGGLNLYGFARNNPIQFVDTDGQQLSPPLCNTCGQVALPGHKCVPPPPPTPGDNGNNAKRPGGIAYLRPCGCTSKKDRLSTIPGVSTPPRFPMQSMGPGTGTYEIVPFPTTPPSAVGGGGAGPCNLLVVKCPGFVAVFHFTVGDSPCTTLGRFTWPSGCSSIICGGDDSGQSNCLGDGVKSCANAAGLNVVGVSGNSGCGVDENGNWWQHGN